MYYKVIKIITSSKKQKNQAKLHNKTVTICDIILLNDKILSLKIDSKLFIVFT